MVGKQIGGLKNQVLNILTMSYDLNEFGLFCLII